MSLAASATVERLTVYPIKSLNGRSVDRVEIVKNGGLAGDREYALFDADREYVNGKNEQAVHPISARYSGATARAETVTLSTPEDEPQQFSLPPADDSALTEWLAQWFGYPVSIEQNREGGFPDDTTASGPTIISEATIETVAGWFDGIDFDGMRRRLRPNIVLSGVEPFWEDQLFADRNSRVRFSIGDTDVIGVNPCQRCVVPSRDPDTGTEYDGFNETFIEKRRETLPAWSGGDWFDHEFRLMINTAVPESSWGDTIAVGEELAIGETVSADATP